MFGRTWSKADGGGREVWGVNVMSCRTDWQELAGQAGEVMADAPSPLFLPGYVQFPHNFLYFHCVYASQCFRLLVVKELCFFLAIFLPFFP